MGCFPGQDLSKSEPVGYYDVTLVYKDMGIIYTKKIYGKDMVAVCRRDFFVLQFNFLWHCAAQRDSWIQSRSFRPNVMPSGL